MRVFKKKKLRFSPLIKFTTKYFLKVSAVGGKLRDYLTNFNMSTIFVFFSLLVKSCRRNFFLFRGINSGLNFSRFKNCLSNFLSPIFFLSSFRAAEQLHSKSYYLHTWRLNLTSCVWGFSLSHWIFILHDRGQLALKGGFVKPLPASPEAQERTKSYLRRKVSCWWKRWNKLQSWCHSMEKTTNNRMGQGPLFWDVVGFSVKFVYFLFAFFLVVLTWDLFHIIELCLPSFSDRGYRSQSWRWSKDF